MTRLKREWLVGLLVGTFVLLGSGSVAANSLSESSPDFIIQGPQQRIQELRRGIVEFVGKHPDLTTEQALAIQQLADIDDWSVFSGALDPSSKDMLASKFGELSQVLPYDNYLELLRSFSREFQGWLLRNQLVDGLVAGTDCNCDSRQDCNGNYCANVPCDPDDTTSHDGVCEKGPVVF